MMKWKDVLNYWKKGEFHTYPKRYEGTRNKFLWNTSVLKNNGNTIFKEKYKINKELPVRQNYKAFKEHIQKSKHKYVTSFPNLNGDTILVVPMPRAGKSYATFKDFVDNAPKIQQQEFWKKVATIAEKQMKKFGSVWVSAHGLGVPYLHIRVCSMPKYYFDKDLAKNQMNNLIKGGGYFNFNVNLKIVSKKMSEITNNNNISSKISHTGGEGNAWIENTFGKNLAQKYKLGYDLLNEHKKIIYKEIVDSLQKISIKIIDSSKTYTLFDFIGAQTIVTIIKSYLHTKEEIYKFMLHNIFDHIDIVSYKIKDTGIQLVPDHNRKNSVIETIITNLSNDTLTHITINNISNEFHKQLLNRMIQLCKIDPVNNKRLTNYSIINNKLLNKYYDEIIHKNYLQIWIGCYNTLYIEHKDLENLQDGFFKKYYNLLKTHENSCLIIIEPRIFGMYSVENIGEQALLINKITKQLAEIGTSLYLGKSINFADIHEIIKDFSNNLHILNMAEFFGNKNSYLQIPQCLQDSLWHREQMFYNYELHVSKQMAPNTSSILIATNDDDIVKIREIIYNANNIIRINRNDVNINKLNPILILYIILSIIKYEQFILDKESNFDLTKIKNINYKQRKLLISDENINTRTNTNITLLIQEIKQKFIETHFEMTIDSIKKELQQTLKNIKNLESTNLREGYIIYIMFNNENVIELYIPYDYPYNRSYYISTKNMYTTTNNDNVNDNVNGNNSTGYNEILKRDKYEGMRLIYDQTISSLIIKSKLYQQLYKK